MVAEVRCPECKTSVPVPDTLVGNSFVCPNCNAQLVAVRRSGNGRVFSGRPDLKGLAEDLEQTCRKLEEFRQKLEEVRENLAARLRQLGSEIAQEREEEEHQKSKESNADRRAEPCGPVQSGERPDLRLNSCVLEVGPSVSHSDIISWAKDTFDRNEFLAGLREIERTGGAELGDFIARMGQKELPDE